MIRANRKGFGNDEYCKTLIHCGESGLGGPGTFDESSFGGNSGAGHTCTLMDNAPFSPALVTDSKFGEYAWKFSCEFSKYSLATMVKSQNNLVVIQTLSKSFGLAGLRLGYFMANKQFTEIFNKILQYPYPLSTLTIESGILALEKSQQMKDAVQIIKQERKRIIENLRKYSTFEVFDSEANFVLFDAHGSYQRIFTALSEQGISIRKLGKIGKHEGCLRVTIGTKEMNSKFLLAIRDLLR